MKIPRKKRNLIVCTALIAVAGGILCLYALRNSILHRVADKRIERLEHRYGVQIDYRTLRMEGCNVVTVEGLSVTPLRRDTLLALRSARVELDTWRLLTGSAEVHDVQVDGLTVSFVKQDSVANYDFLFLQRQPAEETPVEKGDYARRVNSLLDWIYDLLPPNGQLSHIELTERKDHHRVSVRLPSLRIEKNHFSSKLQIREDSLPLQQWWANGELNRENRTLRTELHGEKGKKVSLPYITRRFGAQITFDTLSYSLTKEAGSGGRVNLQGKARVNGLDVYHQALSPEVIHLDRGHWDYHLNIASHALELDSTSTVVFNKLQFHPYLRAEKKEGAWHLTAAVNKPWFPADDLFSSLPQGLFDNLEGIRTDGELAYHFLLDLDFARLDSLRLESDLRTKGFRLVKYGATSLSKMSGEFMYTAYEDGQPVRTFPVGPSWEHFTPLDSIAPVLRMSVLQSEDGAFFYHQGFLPDALREALIYDLKVKRFARGGSTITMQLVKNVFLNRKKNFARKLEEALIVWLIETLRLTSKERMYEVYLNIAEWGPLVYGIHEAADFYFGKRPSQLNTEESIFLASIIPKPKHYRNSLTEDGWVKESLEGYYRLIAGRLAAKGIISESEADTIRPHVRVKAQWD